MGAMRVLLYLVAAVALAVTVQLPTARGHEAAHHHGHHGHHHDEHEHDGHVHGHGGDGHGHTHGHHDHKHVEEAHAHEHQHHDHHHHHHDHDHHDHKHVKEAHGHEHDAHDHHGHDHAHHDHHDHHHHDHQKTPASKGTAGQAIDRFSPRVWAEALFATALVGAAPVVVLLFLPLGRGSAEAQKPLLRVFLSFAAGGLMGDALLHLLPHSLPSGGHAHDHHGHDHHDHVHSLADLAVWLYCLAGMMAFLMLEKFVRAQTGDGHGHSHGHSHGPRTAPQEEKPTPDGLRRRNVAGKKKSSDDEAPAAKTTAEESKPSKEPARISAAGYLNLAADFSHNFTDGLAIGATFLRGSGWQTTVAMLLHEVPHEIGDFAILIQSGFTRRQAMLTQLGTALGAMAGTVLGLLIEGAGDSGSAWISPFTAGGFIYIACASVMPELLEDCSLKQSLQEGVAMCLGIGLMVVIALYE